MRRHGFVYTDVLTTLLVLMIVYALFLTNMHNSLEAGRRTACLQNLQQIGHALSLYALDYSGAFPSEQAGLSALVDTYAADPAIFECPQIASRVRHEQPSFLATAVPVRSSYHIDYCYRGGLFSDDLPTAAIASDLLAHTHRQGANTLFVDGSVLWRARPDVDAETQLRGMLLDGGLHARPDERGRVR